MTLNQTADGNTVSTPHLYDRAARIFGTSHGEIRWPYEASGLNRSLWRIDPERFRREVAAYDRMRLVIVEWAERYGLKASEGGCCPQWLQRDFSRRCGYGRARRGDQCTSGFTGLDGDWLDHPIRWIKDGKPAAITSSPYDGSMPTADNERIARWLAKDDRLSVAFGDGWYGPSTTQVVMWRSDRIPVIEPAPGDGGWYELMTQSARMADTPATT